MQTKIIKLQNGIDLIANVTQSMESYILEEPMEFEIELRGNNPGGLLMRHYLPVQLIKKNEIEIHKSSILSFLDPEEQFCVYYINTIEKIKELLAAKEIVDGMTDEEINNIMSEFEDVQQHGYTLH